MSKLFTMYQNLKSENSSDLYLFKSGMFYIFLDDDARKINELLGLKLTNLNSSVQKCGFPQNSLNKYLKLLNYLPYSIKIIDGSSMTKYNVSEYILDQNCFNILSKLSSVDINSLSAKRYSLNYIFLYILMFLSFSTRFTLKFYSFLPIYRKE